MITRRHLFGLMSATIAAVLVPTDNVGAYDRPDGTYATPTYIRIGPAGQSLAAHWMTTPAFASFRKRLQDLGETRSIAMTNVAVGGSSLLKKYCSTQYPTYYWWDETKNVPGPMLERAITMLKRDTQKVNVLLWVQGERDSGMYHGKTEAEDRAFHDEYVSCALKVFNALRRAVNPTAPLSVPVFVQQLGPRSSGWAPYRGMPIVRKAEATLVGKKGYNIYWGCRPDPFIELKDGVHPSDASYEWIGLDTADCMRGRI